MQFIENIRQWFAPKTTSTTDKRATEQKITKERFAELVRANGGFHGSYAGVTVTPDTAMQSSAVLACIKVISEDIASLPIHVYKKTEKGRERATKHYAYKLLHDAPNVEQTRPEFVEMMMNHVLRYGNAYAYIKKVGAKPVELIPLSPTETRAKRVNGKIQYHTKVNGVLSDPISPEFIIHIKAMPHRDGIHGVSPIEYAASTIGVALAADKFGERFFAQGTVLGGYLKHPGRLSDDAEEALRKSWVDIYSGVQNAHKTPLLEEGLTFEPFGVPPEQAQFLETRKFQATDIAREYRVNPAKIGELDQYKYATLEQSYIDHVRSCLRPWVIKIECEFIRKLLLESDKETHTIEFDFDAMLRGDRASQDASFTAGIVNGWYSINDVRRFINMPEIEGGDAYRVQLNTAPVVDEPGTDPEPEPSDDPGSEESPEETDDEPTKDDAAERSHYYRLFEDAAKRVLTKEIKAITRFKGKPNVGELANKLYDDHAATIRQAFTAVIHTACGDTEIMDRFVDTYIQEHRTLIHEAIEFDALDELVNRLEKKHTVIATDLITGKYDNA